MKRESKSYLSVSGWHRLIAAVLALSMVVIPVHFPGNANAAEENLPDTFYKEDFNTEGITYRWETRTNTEADKVASATVADGKMSLSNPDANTGHDGQYVTSILTAKSGETDDTDQWTNYTVEMKGKILTSGSNQTKLGIMGRISKDTNGNMTFYYAYIRAGVQKVYLYKCTMNAAGAQTLVTELAAPAVTSTVANGADNTLKMTFKGNEIKVYLDDVEYISLEDDSSTHGGVGIQLTRRGTAEVDYVKVTHGDATTGFVENFADSRYIDGVEYDWAIHTKTATNQAASATVANGKMSLSNYSGATTQASSDAHYATAILAAQSGNADYTDQWTNYTVEMKGKILSSVSNQTKLGIMGRISKDTNGNMTFYYAYIRSGGQKVYLYKYTLSAAGTQSTTPTAIGTGSYNLTSATVANNVDNILKMTFEDKRIKVFLDDELCFDLEDESSTHGGVGIQLTRYGSAEVDYVKVYPTGADAGEGFTEYTFFDAATPADLSSQWVLTPSAQGSFAIAENQLTYTDETGAVGVAVLKAKAKTIMADSAVIAEGTVAANGGFAVLGRYDAAANNYYKLSMDLDDGLKLIRCVSGTETEIGTISRNDLWKDHGVMLTADTVYLLKLQMVDGQVKGFIDDLRIFSWKDPDWVAEGTLSSGVGGVELQNGSKLARLEIAQPEGVNSLSIIDAEGQAIGTAENPFKAPLGKYPEIKRLYLVTGVDADGAPETMILDRANVGEMDSSTIGVKHTTVEYDGITIEFYYEVIDRTAQMQALNGEIAALDVNALTVDDKAKVYDLSARLDDLSIAEREKNIVTEENVAKLESAEEKILLLLYPELVGTEEVFRDEFDTAESEKQYSNNMSYTSTIDEGKWFVENGSMMMYDTFDSYYPTGFTCATMLMKRDFVARYVSVDVQFISDKAWAGITFNHRNDEFFTFRVVNKGNRVVFGKNTTTQTIYTEQVENPITFNKYQWYNIKVTISEDGLVKAFVDDRLWFTYQDEKTPTNPNLLTHGTVTLSASENWVKFDNLVIRGEELPWTPEENDYLLNENMQPGETYTDNFNNETLTKDPSHWIESNLEEKWEIVDDGTGNKVYASSDCLSSSSHTWLSVFETDVDYTAKLKVTEKSEYASVALTSRVTAYESYVNAGYDFTLQKWYIAVKRGKEYPEVRTWAENVSAFNENTWYTVRLTAEGKVLKVYVDGNLMVTADADRKVTVGRVGVLAERCNVQVDDVELKLLSGQSHVQDGVLEYYTKESGMPYDHYVVLEGKNGELFLYSDEQKAVSTDGGKTWTLGTWGDGSYKNGSNVLMHNGWYMSINTKREVRISKDGGYTWEQVETPGPGNAGTTYVSQFEHITEVQLSDGTYRVFYCLMPNHKDKATAADAAGATRFATSEVWYSDDYGVTWKQSKNSPYETSNLETWSEAYVIATKGALEGDPLIHFTSYSSSGDMRYSLSYDDGETWVGDYAMPQIYSRMSSFSVEEDPYNRGTYYMAVNMSPATGLANHLQTRNNVTLMRSTDGFNWEFLCTVDRYDPTNGVDTGAIMHYVNMYMTVTKDHVFVTFGRSDERQTTGNLTHNKQEGHIYRFEKSKLNAHAWPVEYIVPNKAITYIDMPDEELVINSAYTLEGKYLTVYYYNGTSEQISLNEAIVTLPDFDSLGKKTVIVDYKYFRELYTVEVISGDAPVISGVENGKTYCGAQTVTVTDANNDLVSVTLNGNAVALTDGKFTVSAAEGQQTIVATDKAGNVTTIKITVNAGHTGGTATCTDKAACEVCGEGYGELNADKHTKEAKWTTTEDKHSKAYECCGKVVVAEEAHKGGTATCEHKAKCEVCNAEYGALAAHKGGTATCADKAACEVCGEAYGELNADKHTKEAKWAITADKHSKAYECCGKVVIAEEDHEWKDGKCEECGYEAELGTEQKPIEIPADKETVKEEAKVEAGEEMHYELDEKLAGKVITVKGEGAYIIVDGKKYEAKNGIVEVKLPTKTGKISVVIGNAGTKAGTFSITIATPSEDNSDTGDNAAIVLFGSLMALSALAAGVLLIPNIRKRLIK